MIRFTCNSCGTAYKVQDGMAGKRGKCQSCGQVLEIPMPTAVTEPADQAGSTPSITGGASLARDIFVRAAEQGLGLGKRIYFIKDISPKCIANARQRYAKTMTDVEAPLLMIDTSLSGNSGKEGVLITNQCVYASTLDAPIPFVDIRSSHMERINNNPMVFGPKPPGLFINGKAVYTHTSLRGAKGVEEIAHAIRMLAMESRRQVEVDSTTTEIPCDTEIPSDVVRMIAAGVVAGKTTEELQELVRETDMAEFQVQSEDIVSKMQASYGRRRIGFHLTVLLGGLLFFLLGISVAVILGYGNPLFKATGLALGFVGLGTAGTSFVRIVTGARPDTNTLVKESVKA